VPALPLSAAAATPDGPAGAVSSAPTTVAEQRALLDRLGIKGSGEAE